MSPRAPLPDLRRRLLRWFDAHRRELPWRRTRDPWAVLVSEVMLQQTTVAAVVPYYERFMQRWPDPAALASAGQDELLAAWAGLGYYSRARRLMQTACLVAESGGALPADHAGLLALPGVGDYTAAAVASIAYGQAVPVVDGNVERVLTRLAAIPGDPKQAATRRAILRLAGELLSPRRPGDFNQAVMELGATLCRPREPRCDACPLRPGCAAHADGEVERFPELPRRAPATIVTRVALLCRRRGRGWGRLLTRRRVEAPNAGFLELPGSDLPAERLDAAGQPLDAAGDLLGHLAAAGLVVSIGQALPVHRHSITRYRIRVHPYRGSLSSGRVCPPYQWTRADDCGAPLTTATRAIVARSADDLFDTAP